MERVILTYGTFDMFHIGHLNLLKKLKGLGDYLIVGVSTDEFNEGKGKKTIIPFSDRAEIVKNVKHVDMVIPECTWNQKVEDIIKYSVNVFGIGDDWKGKFDHLSELCEVVYLPRTKNISSTQLKNTIKYLDKKHVHDLKNALDGISAIVDRMI